MTVNGKSEVKARTFGRNIESDLASRFLRVVETAAIASAHTMATVPNFFRQEFMVNDVPWRDACLSHPLPIEEGCFVLPDRPGLGFDVNEAELSRHPGLRSVPEGRNFYV